MISGREQLFLLDPHHNRMFEKHSNVRGLKKGLGDHEVPKK